MRFQVRTAVAGDHRAVFHRFDHALLLRLAPPLTRLELLHADEPSQPDGRIRLRVTMLGIIRQDWENSFSGYELRDDECHFVDHGVRMPWPIRLWRHDHRVLAADGHTVINDDVTYETGLRFFDWLVFPVIWGQFAYRKPVYRRIFGVP